MLLKEFFDKIATTFCEEKYFCFYGITIAQILAVLVHLQVFLNKNYDFYEVFEVLEESISAPIEPT